MAPPSTPDKLPCGHMFGDTVVINVGRHPERQSFTMHKGVLAFYSGYFKAALKERFKEGESSIIDLPTESVSVFKKFVAWVYTGDPEYDHYGEHACYRELFELWVFADRRQIPLLMNEVINELRDHLVEVKVPPCADDLRFLYENTMPTAQIRKFLLHAMCHAGGLDTNSVELLEWPTEPLVDCIVSLAKLGSLDISQRMTADKLEDMNMCKWHVHEEGVSCDDEE